MKKQIPARPLLVSRINRIIEQEWNSTLSRANEIADLFYELFPKPRRYKHTFDDLDLSFLRQLWNEVIASKRNDVHLGQLGASYAGRSRITQLRFHALVAKVRNDKGKHIPSHWLITRRGGQFLRDEIAIPKVVETVDNEVQHDKPPGEMIRVSDFGKLDDFGPHFTWEIDDQNVLRPTGQQPML